MVSQKELDELFQVLNKCEIPMHSRLDPEHPEHTRKVQWLLRNLPRPSINKGVPGVDKAMRTLRKMTVTARSTVMVGGKHD